MKKSVEELSNEVIRLEKELGIARQAWEVATYKDRYEKAKQYIGRVFKESTGDITEYCYVTRVDTEKCKVIGYKFWAVGDDLFEFRFGQIYHIEEKILDKELVETTLEDFKENFDKVLTQIHELHNALRR